MQETYNIYCDESGHLQNDRQRVMILGAIWCPLGKTREIAERIRDIKERHGIAADFEIKWTKVSPAKVTFYLDLLDYFFDNSDLHFRALIVPDKSLLRHDEFRQDHDTWYYKMYFDMIKALLNPRNRYRIYLDIKDTQGGEKTRRLHEILSKNMYDFHREIIEWIQIVRSHEIEQMQLADLLIGAVSYANRELRSNSAKVAFVERMRRRSGYLLTKTTLIREPKVNIFRWEAATRGSGQ